MKVELLPSSYAVGGAVSQRQHLSCIVIDDTVAFDAGSLALSCSDLQRSQIRDVVISHAHLDHVAGLPLFIDDLFATTVEPVRIHAIPEIIEVLERDIFNWSVFPRFSELRNEHGPVVEYCPFESGRSVPVAHLKVNPIEVNHKVPSIGAIISHGGISIGLTGDTARTERIWAEFNSSADLAAIFVECAFPDDLADLAVSSHHLTPSGLADELEKFKKTDVPIFVVNIKPMFRGKVVKQLADLAIQNLRVLEIGRVYEF